MTPTIISYYTPNYQDSAQKLIASISKLGLPSSISAIPDHGSWKANSYYKATFIREKLLELQKPIVWTDADSIIHSYPKFFDALTCDIAVRYQDFPYRKHECLSGTLYLNYSEKAIKLVDNWIAVNRECYAKELMEQNNLAKAIEKTAGLNIAELPAEYVFIFDTMRKLYPKAIPVVEHFQASRKAKRK